MSHRIPTFGEIRTVAASRGHLSEAPDLWSGLVGWWPLQEGGGATAFDVSGYGNDGSFNNMDGTNYGPGYLTFNGSDEDVLVPQQAAINYSQLSVVVRLRSAGYVSNDAFVSQGAFGPFVIQVTDVTGVNADYKTSVRQSDGTYLQPITTGRVLTAGPWHTIALVYDGQTCGNYLDGAFKVSASDNVSPLIASTNDLWIGSYDGSNYWAAADIAGVWKYSRALGQSELGLLHVDPWAMGRLRPRVFAVSAPTPPSGLIVNRTIQVVFS